jgi:hypothetical protein
MESEPFFFLIFRQGSYSGRICIPGTQILPEYDPLFRKDGSLSIYRVSGPDENALSASLMSLPFVRHSAQPLKVVYELFENLECSSVHVYDVANADEKESGEPIYAQARPQPILGEPTYRLTYLTKCEVGTTEGHTSKEIGAGCSPDDETGYTRIDRLGDAMGGSDSLYSRLQWGGDAGSGEPVYSHLLQNAGGDDVDESDYSHFVCNSAGVRVLIEDVDEASDRPHCKFEGVGEDDWATVMGSQVRRNGVRSGSRGSWSTVGTTEGISLIEAMERAQSAKG